jgi:precorrin-4 methylase
MSSFDFFRDIVDRAEQRSRVDVYVVGAGIKHPDHLTQEGVEALKRCQVVYTLLGPDGDLAPIEAFGPRVESLAHVYQGGRLRREIYHDVVSAVLDGAARERPVAYLAMGNPLIFDDISRWIAERGRERGLSVRVLPGISSIDTLLVDLEHEIGTSGLQIYGASWFVIYRIEPRVDVPCLLLQPAAFGTSYATLHHDPNPETFAPLRDHLLRFYPPEHELVLVRSAAAWHDQEQVHRFPLGDLCSVGREEVRNASLFIPRLRAPEPDRSFGSKMYDRSHFAESYRPVE